MHDNNMRAPRARLVRHLAPRPPRRYRQEARARQTSANTDRIVAATLTLVKAARRVSHVTLDDIARQSGLTVRTLLRRFGSRDRLLETAFARLKDEIKSLRVPTAPGDIDAAVRSLLDQYERMGDMNIRALEEEDQLPLIHRMLQYARASHREWLRHVFGPLLATLDPAEHDQRINALYAATDIYLWKLLRRDLALDLTQTTDIVGRLVRGALANTQSSPVHVHTEG